MGKNSEEFKSALLDTSAWRDRDSCVWVFAIVYLRHPAYQDYPVVCISQKQALDYSKWRSDRVFESYLISYGVIKPNPDQTMDMYFSVENYFAGRYLNYKPDTNYNYYPSYRLPSVLEYKQALHYTDSVNKEICQNFKCGIVPCVNDSFKVMPTIERFLDCSKKSRAIHNLRGNVGEWTFYSNISVGGGWADSKERILSQDTFQILKPDASIGFRNVCEWKQWKK